MADKLTEEFHAHWDHCNGASFTYISGLSWYYFTVKVIGSVFIIIMLFLCVMFASRDMLGKCDCDSLM